VYEVLFHAPDVHDSKIHRERFRHVCEHESPCLARVLAKIQQQLDESLLEWRTSIQNMGQASAVARRLNGNTYMKQFHSLVQTLTKL
jgi:hypothetical protein